VAVARFEVPKGHFKRAANFWLQMGDGRLRGSIVRNVRNRALIHWRNRIQPLAAQQLVYGQASLASGIES
jgi:hypothetical protein